MGHRPKRVWAAAHKARPTGRRTCVNRIGTFDETRPERITLFADKPEGGADNLVAGVLEGSTYLGQDLIVFVRVSGLDKPLVLRRGAAGGRGLDLQEGAAVWCGWPAAASRVLTG